MGGVRPGSGPPRKAELAAKEAALMVWEKEIERREKILARRYVGRAMKSDRVLLDLRRTRIPDAKQSIELEHTGKITSTVIVETVDPRGITKK